MKNKLFISIIGLLAFLFVQNTTLAQEEAKIITAAEFDEIEFECNQIANYPEKLLPKGVSNIIICIADEGHSAQLIYQLKDTYKIFPTVECAFSYNPNIKNGADYIGGLIHISTLMPRSEATSTGVFKLTGNTLEFLREDYNDPGAETQEKAEQALEEGDIKKAAELFIEKMYPPLGYYEETQERLFIKAQKVAFEFSKNKETKKAAEILGYAYDFDPIDLESDIFDNENMVKILANYSYFLEKAKMYKKCIEVATLLNLNEPKMAGPFLHIGDSYYHTGEKIKALKAYKNYSELRIEQGKENKIPTYLKDRIVELEKLKGNYNWKDFIADCEEKYTFDTRKANNLPQISKEQAEYIKNKFKIDAHFHTKPVIFNNWDYTAVLVLYDQEEALCGDLLIFDTIGNLKTQEKYFLVGSSGTEYASSEYAIIQNHENNEIRSVNRKEKTEKGKTTNSARFFSIDSAGKMSLEDYPKKPENIYFYYKSQNYSLQANGNFFKFAQYDDNTITVWKGTSSYDENKLQLVFTEKFGTKGVGNKNENGQYEHTETYNLKIDKKETVNWVDIVADLHLNKDENIDKPFTKVTKNNPAFLFLTYSSEFNKNNLVELSDNFIKALLELPINFPGRDEVDAKLANYIKYAETIKFYSIGTYIYTDNMPIYFIYSAAKYNYGEFHYIDAFIYDRNNNFLKAINIYSGNNINNPLLIDEKGNLIINDSNYEVNNLKIEIDNNAWINYLDN